jgi:hypothetical protein
MRTCRGAIHRGELEDAGRAGVQVFYSVQTQFDMATAEEVAAVWGGMK